jgi:hypothetical protein
MDFWQSLMLAAAVLCALAWRWNATAAALAFSYFATQAWWLIAGRPLDAGEMFMIDVLTASLIFCKAIARSPADGDFKTAREHLRRFLSAPTLADRIVLACFPLMWASYVLTISDFARWYVLYGLAMAQFLAALSEAVSEWRKAKAPVSEQDTPSSGLMRVAWGTGGGT